MHKLATFILSILFLCLCSSDILAQEYSPLSFRLHLQPQVSSLNPYDPGFISDESLITPSFAFGVEVSKNLSKHVEISLGYHYSSQAGNYSLRECNSIAPVLDFIGGNIGARRNYQCPTPRGKIRMNKIPVSLGFRIIQNEKFMSRISMGPQLQFILNPPTWGLYNYKKASLAFMTEWSNYFKLSKNLALVTGVRVDRGVTSIDHNSLDRAIGNSLGLVLGAEYTLWTESK